MLSRDIVWWPVDKCCLETIVMLVIILGVLDLQFCLAGLVGFPTNYSIPGVEILAHAPVVGLGFGP